MGLLGARSEEASAHNPLKKCKKKSGDAKTKCIKKAKRHNAQHASETVLLPSPVGCPVGMKPCDGACIATNQCCTKADCPSGASYQCCNGLCTDAKRVTGALCSTDAQCCSDYCRARDEDFKTCSESCRGKPCDPSIGCCRGQACLNVGSNGQGTCGGCKGAGGSCKTDAECCFSACEAAPGSSLRFCASYADGPCEKSIDCRSCWVGQECISFLPGYSGQVCKDGTCVCPDECCKNSDCPPQHNCIRNSNGLNGECMPQVIG